MIKNNFRSQFKLFIINLKYNLFKDIYSLLILIIMLLYINFSFHKFCCKSKI